MRRRASGSINILVWVLIAVLYLGSSFLEGLHTVTTDVEYDSNMETSNYQVDVDLSEDNSYLVKETITVDMLSPRHGIYRYIPQKGYSEAYDSSNQLKRIPYYADIEVVDCNTEVSTETSDGFFVMRLGSEYHTVYGEETYTLTYRVTPHFQNKNYDCIYYNLFPMTWQNSIPAGSSFAMTFPKEFDHEKVQLYYGQYGSTEDGEEILNLSWNGNVLTGRLESDIPFANGVTLFANVGADYFTGSHTIFRADLVILAVALLVLGLIILLFFLFGRDEQIIPSVQYQPPQGLDSAAVGYIIDGSVEDKDILSLIIYWADQGYLKIEERGKDNLYFVKTDKEMPEDAPRYGAILFQEIFKGKKETSVKSLKYKCADTIGVSKVHLKAYVDGKGGIYSSVSEVCRVVTTLLGILPMGVFVGFLAVFSKLSILRVIFYVSCVVLLLAGCLVFNHIVDNWYARTKGTRVKMAVLGIGLSMLSIAMLSGSYLMQLYQGEVFQWVVPLIAVAVASGVSVVLTGFMKKRTGQCVQWMGYLAGLRDFIETAELDRLKALAEENPQWFYHILPYTYVFGLSDIFAKKLEGLALPAPQWYSSYAPDYGSWNYFHFHHAFMRNMNTMSNTLTISEPVKTSGFSGGSGGGGGFSGGGFGGGGGFSGGGFGGGGGGSW